jgi:hypothetical protein
MSNLHKDLNDSQLHVPKGFAGASNTTRLTKNASGQIAWVDDSGGDVKDFVQQSFRGCAEGSMPKGSEISNLYARQLGCREMRYSDFFHGTDLGTGTFPTPLLPVTTIIEASEITVAKNGNVVAFSGGFNALSLGNVALHLGKISPNCEEPVDGYSINLLCSASVVPAGKGYNCFEVTGNFAVTKGDILIPLIQFGASNSITYHAQILIQN